METAAGGSPGGPLADPWCHSLSSSIDKIGVAFIMKLKTSRPQASVTVKVVSLFILP